MTDFGKKISKLILPAAAAGALALSGCQRTVQAPEPVCHPGRPEAVLYMPDGTAHSYEMRGGEHKLMGPVTPNYAVGTLEVLLKGDGCTPISSIVSVNRDVNMNRVAGLDNENIDHYAFSAETPRNDDNTSFALNRSSIEPIVNTNYSLGTIQVSDANGLRTSYEIVLPVQYTPLQVSANFGNDASRRTAANELSTYQQMTQDGRLVTRSPAQILEDLTQLADYDNAMVSVYARPDTSRNEVVLRGTSGNNTLSYGFVNEGQSPLERTESLERLGKYVTNGFFNKDMFQRSYGR
jgi:hypothetical protein